MAEGRPRAALGQHAIVVFAHIPLWTVYDRGVGAPGRGQALGYLNASARSPCSTATSTRSLQKVEGNVTFHTARSTAFPQPAPGTAPSAGPMVVPAGQLRSVLGITEVKYIPKRGHLAVVDSSLA